MKRIQIVLITFLGYILRFFGFRPAVIWLPDRIGHLVGEVDTLYKEWVMGVRRGKPLLIFNNKRLANSAVLDMWKRVVTVIVWPWLYETIRVNKDRLASWDVIYLDSHGYAQLCSEYQGPSPLKLSEEEDQRGQALLRKLGIDSNNWYVCFHNREAGYLPKMTYHSYRDAPVLNLDKAMRWVVEQGGIAIRMGDSSMTPLPPSEGVIDYALSPHRSPFLDVYLSATCRFMLGCSSGLFCLSAIFGRPVACANMTPLSSIPFYPGNLFISKLVRETETGRLLTFRELLKGDVGGFCRLEEYEALGLETVCNDDEDLLELTREIFNATAKGGALAEPNPWQQAFRELLQPKHAGYNTRAVMGAAFAEKYQNLL